MLDFISSENCQNSCGRYALINGVGSQVEPKRKGSLDASKINPVFLMRKKTSNIT